MTGKPRAKLSASEISRVQDELLRRLETIGVQSQPEVAFKILDLTRDPGAELKDLAQIVRSDAGLSGRLLKLANSSHFAQRKPVTNIDRACVLLGLERLKAISLGFHLSRAAQGDGSAEIGRVVWGQSLFRACLAVELAKHVAPGHTAEAYVVGLMMDAGVPLMPRLLGKAFRDIWDSTTNPTRFYRTEVEQLPYSHTDAIAALAKLWRLPQTLAFPLAHHHTLPAVPIRVEPMYRLHAIAYAVATLDFSVGDKPPVTIDTPGMNMVRGVLGLEPDAIKPCVTRAAGEYSATSDLFSDLADRVAIDDLMLDRMQAEVVNAMDLLIESGSASDVGAACLTRSFNLGGHRVELERSNAGSMVAYLYDSRGQRIISHVFNPGGQTCKTLRMALGLEAHANDDAAALDEFLAAA